MEKITQSRVCCHKGFFALALLSWSPLLLALIAGMAVIANGITTLQRSENECFATHLRLQKNLRMSLESLLALNPKAAALRRQRDLAETNLKAALASGLPPWIAEATAQRTFVIGLQSALQIEQRLILANAQRMRLETTIELENKMAKLKIKTLPTFANFKRSLAVEPNPISSLSPNYELSSNFSVDQSQRSQLLINFGERMPLWISKKIYSTKISCGASLKSQSNLLKLVLLKARSS